MSWFAASSCTSTFQTNSRIPNIYDSQLTLHHQPAEKQRSNPGAVHRPELQLDQATTPAGSPASVRNQALPDTHERLICLITNATAMERTTTTPVILTLRKGSHSRVATLFKNQRVPWARSHHSASHESGSHQSKPGTARYIPKPRVMVKSRPEHLGANDDQIPSSDVSVYPDHNLSNTG